MLKLQITKCGNVTVFCVQGRIVRGETEALRSAVLAEQDVSAVVLDLARVSVIDAGGLGVMLELRAQLELQGTEFRLRNVTKLVQQVLAITRLDEVFEILNERELRHVRFARAAGSFHAAACA
jgi:anti-sigma B factor antagonist